MNISILESTDLTNIESLLLDSKKQLQIVPSSDLKEFKQEEISLFCVKYGFYCIPTTELIEFIKNELNLSITYWNIPLDPKKKMCVEIGAGQATIAQALNIPACDNFMQDQSDIKAYYLALKQSTVPYNYDYTTHLPANDYVRAYSPKNVIAAWVTHVYNPLEHWREGNAFGVDEKAIIDVANYLFIGNKNTHGKKSILDIKHDEYQFDWLYSRSMAKDQNVIWIWRKDS